MNTRLIVAEDAISQEHFSLLPYGKGPSDIVPDVALDTSLQEQCPEHVTLAEDELRVLPAGLTSRKRGIAREIMRESGKTLFHAHTVCTYISTSC